MSLTLAAVYTAAESTTTLAMPAPLYGILVLAVFGLLGIVTWSYRSVSNRHSQVSGRPGGDGSGHTSTHDG